jgi:hypothetical protein
MPWTPIADVGIAFPFQSDQGMEGCDSPSATAEKESTAKPWTPLRFLLTHGPLVFAVDSFSAVADGLSQPSIQESTAKTKGPCVSRNLSGVQGILFYDTVTNVFHKIECPGLHSDFYLHMALWSLLWILFPL